MSAERVFQIFDAIKMRLENDLEEKQLYYNNGETYVVG